MSRVTGCYSCGAINGSVVRGKDDEPLCGECNSPTVLSMLELLDVASQHFRYSDDLEALDEILELHEEYDFDD